MCRPPVLCAEALTLCAGAQGEQTGADLYSIRAVVPSEVDCDTIIAIEPTGC